MSGQFVLNPKEEQVGSNFLDTFETFYSNSLADFGLYDKVELQPLLSQWKARVNPRHFASITLDVMIDKAATAQNSCTTADCINTTVPFTYTPSTGGQLSESIPSTGCLSRTSDPRWFYMRIQNPGQFIIHMSATNNKDIDFIVWGPFTSPTAPCFTTHRVQNHRLLFLVQL